MRNPFLRSVLITQEIILSQLEDLTARIDTLAATEAETAQAVQDAANRVATDIQSLRDEIAKLQSAPNSPDLQPAIDKIDSVDAGLAQVVSAVKAIDAPVPAPEPTPTPEPVPPADVPPTP